MWNVLGERFAKVARSLMTAKILLITLRATREHRPNTIVLWEMLGPLEVADDSNQFRLLFPGFRDLPFRFDSPRVVGGTIGHEHLERHGDLFQGGHTPDSTPCGREPAILSRAR